VTRPHEIVRVLSALPPAASLSRQCFPNSVFFVTRDSARSWADTFAAQVRKSTKLRGAVALRLIAAQRGAIGGAKSCRCRCNAGLRKPGCSLATCSYLERAASSKSSAKQQR